MKNSKNIFKRMVTVFIASIMMAIAFSFSTVNAFAIEEKVIVESVATLEETPTTISAIPIVSAESMKMVFENVKPVQLAGAADGGDGSSLGSQTDGDSQFQAIVEFFVKWFKRIGLLIAFVGGIMFALAIKNNDAEQKQNGLLTMVAGFVVAALCGAVDMFDIFS